VSEHRHDWLDEREPDDRPSLWDERDIDVPYNPDPDDESWRDEPEEEHDEEEPGYYTHRQAGGIGWNKPAVLWDGIQEREEQEYGDDRR